MSMPSPDLIHRMRRALLGFYDARRRALPWRQNPEPYRVWVSEVMLQQTRVDAVLPYYRSWMARFPTVEALAEAPLDDVLKAWEGLGYYSRARNLHRAARMVRERRGGALPSSAASLRELPGVGEYTAGAVASIAFGERVAAVDGNVRRVLARLFDEADPGARWLRERAGALVDPERPGDFNQALMELGATVCTPRSPSCAECPLSADCAALARGTVAARPLPRRRTPTREVRSGVAALLRRGEGGGASLLLVRRPPNGLLGGLWELPGAEVGAEGPEEAAERAARGAGVEPSGPPVPLPPVTQAYTHFRGVYLPFLWRLEADVRCAPGPEGGAPRAWVDRDGLERAALSAAQRRIAESVFASHL